MTPLFANFRIKPEKWSSIWKAFNFYFNVIYFNHNFPPCYFTKICCDLSTFIADFWPSSERSAQQELSTVIGISGKNDLSKIALLQTQIDETVPTISISSGKSPG